MSRRTHRHDDGRVAVDDRDGLDHDGPDHDGPDHDDLEVIAAVIGPDPLEEFWGADSLATEENAEALATLLDEDHDADAAARATRSYMGTAAGEEEREQLARWAESKACSRCRRRLTTTHDPAALPHDGCRNALRTARLLTRDA
jgi:hypothetical protein